MTLPLGMTLLKILRDSVGRSMLEHGACTVDAAMDVLGLQPDNEDTSHPSRILTARAPALAKGKDCATCGKHFKRKDNEGSSDWGMRRFCSQACSAIAHKKRERKRIVEWRGEKREVTPTTIHDLRASTPRQQCLFCGVQISDRINTALICKSLDCRAIYRVAKQQREAYQHATNKARGAYSNTHKGQP